MSKSSKGYQEPTHDEIAAYAQSIYEQDGRPEGKSVEHWLHAEAQLIAERKARAAQPAIKTAAKSAASPASAPKGKARPNNSNNWQDIATGAPPAPRANSSPN